MVTKRVIVLPKPGEAEAAPPAAPEAAAPPAPTAGPVADPPAPRPAAPIPAVPPAIEEATSAAPAAPEGEAVAVLPETAGERPVPGVFWPLLLLALTWAAWSSFQGFQLVRDRIALQATHAQQQPLMEKAVQLRGRLDALAADTQRLADTGNPQARQVVDELRRRGISINPEGAKKP